MLMRQEEDVGRKVSPSKLAEGGVRKQAGGGGAGRPLLAAFRSACLCVHPYILFVHGLHHLHSLFAHRCDPAGTARSQVFLRFVVFTHSESCFEEMEGTLAADAQSQTSQPLSDEALVTPHNV